LIANSLFVTVNQRRGPTGLQSNSWNHIRNIRH